MTASRGLASRGELEKTKRAAAQNQPFSGVRKVSPEGNCSIIIKERIIPRLVSEEIFAEGFPFDHKRDYVRNSWINITLICSKSPRDRHTPNSIFSVSFLRSSVERVLRIFFRLLVSEPDYLLCYPGGEQEDEQCDARSTYKKMST